MTVEKNITFDVLIEIPKGSRNKYEYDFSLKKIRYDRMIFSSMMYPADYGFTLKLLLWIRILLMYWCWFLSLPFLAVLCKLSP